MGLFSRNKKTKADAAEKTAENPTWNKDLKRNASFEMEAEQQGFTFEENIDVDSVSDVSGTEKGLSCNPLKITPDQIKILNECDEENSAEELMEILGRTHKTRFKRDILNPLLDCQFLERTIPDSPTSPKQKYRPTGKFVSANLL